MNGWIPEPGDDAVRVVTIDMSEPVTMADVAPSGDPGVEDSPLYETEEVWLRVPVLDVSGTQATIEQFGERQTVPVDQLHTEPIRNSRRLFPAHAGSPFPTLDAVIEEVRRLKEEP